MTESRLPPLAVILGIAGLVPLIVCALAAAHIDPSGNTASMVALITYGAVVLSFLGGVHWGFVIEGEKEPSERARLGLGVVPALLGWSAALLAVSRHGVLGLLLLIAGFLATVIVEGHARKWDLVPRAYLVLRWGLTVVVVAILTTVLVLRMVGADVEV
jgi:hypothetical protein